MKRQVKWILGLVAAALAAPAIAAQVTLAWDYPTGTNVTGFRLFCERSSGNFGAPIATTNEATRQVTVTLPNGRAYCVARAYDAVGESDNSNVVTFIESPGNLRKE